MPVRRRRPDGEWEQVDPRAKDELYVVIGNYGRGVQTMWPGTDRPEAYPRRKAEQIAKKQNDSQRGRPARPGGNAHWHAKPLREALEYVVGRPAAALRRLQQEYGLDYDYRAAGTKTASGLVLDNPTVVWTGREMEIETRWPMFDRDRWDEAAEQLKRKGAKIAEKEVAGTLFIKITI
jgi:hypothetical protein